jgi:regulation of enolase protein 1 (concanavalin A-like superfamily)
MRKINLNKMLGVFLFSILFQQGIIAQTTDSVSIAGIPHKLFWQNAPLNFSNKNNLLSITAGPKADMFRDPNLAYNTDNTPKLLFVADDNFILSAGIEHSFSSKWDGGAIVLVQDGLNWIKFCFEKDYTGAKRVVSVVTRNISDDCNSVEMQKNKVYYKIAKADNVITLYCSADSVAGTWSGICNSIRKAIENRLPGAVAYGGKMRSEIHRHQLSRCQDQGSLPWGVRISRRESLTHHCHPEEVPPEAGLTKDLREMES